jgi:NDP-sugar pyrophosphorylase family protein
LGLLAPPSDTFFVMNGDLLTTLNYSAMRRFHRGHGQIATIGLADKMLTVDLGVIEVAANSAVEKYIEKPMLHYKVSMGIYLFEPEVLRYIPRGARLDLPELVMQLVDKGRAPMTFDSQCQWLDIGRLEDYAAATDLFGRNRMAFLPHSAGHADPQVSDRPG